jgi:general secretion pathway protein C
MRGQTKWGRLGLRVGAVCLLNTLVFFPTSKLWAHARSVPPDPAQAEARDPEPAADETFAGRCAGELRLVASVVNEARPQLSLAVVRNAAGARMIAIGGRLDDLVLVALRPDHAELRNESGALCTLPVFDPSSRAVLAQARPSGPRPVPAASPTPKGDPKPRALFTAEELQTGLRALGNGNYLLSRELLLRALKNPGGAAGGAHFRLLERDGRSVGMEVRAVRDGTVLSRMGLSTGDVVRSVNGIDVSTPLGLLDALRSAREADAVALTVVREGQERALRYMIE